MTNEEALKYLKECVDFAETENILYIDTVSVDAIKLAVDAIEQQMENKQEKAVFTAF